MKAIKGKNTIFNISKNTKDNSVRQKQIFQKPTNA